jgi:hypothetical protein
MPRFVVVFVLLAAAMAAFGSLRAVLSGYGESPETANPICC